MKLLFIILSFCLIIKAYSSGQNHTPTDFVLLILSSADENCIIKSKCGPKLDPNTSKPYIFNIADTNSLHNIRVSIYDIIPELRYFSEEEAKIFYENVLFPSAKKAFNEYFGLENYDDFDNMSHDDKIRIKDYITEKIDDMTNRRDVIRELLSSSGNIDKIAFINDGKTKSLYYYGDNSDTNNFYNSFLDYLNDQGTINDFVNQITSNDNDISKSAIQNIAVLCKRRISCKQYFKDANKDQLKFTIIKSINNNNENNYHLIINDLKNERLIHPFTLTEKTKNGEQIFTMNTNFIHKEIPFYNYHAFSSIDIERYKKEIINQINENFKYGNNEDITLQKDIESYSKNKNNPNLLERIKYRIYNILDKTLNSNNENKLSSYDIQKLVDNFINDIDNIDNKNKEKKLFKNIIGNILNNNNIGDEKNRNNLVNNLYNKLDTNDEGLNNQSILQILYNIKNYDYENTIDNTNITFKNKIEEIVRNFLIDNGYETLADINKVIRDISKQIYDENFLMNKNIEYTDSKFLNSIGECIINNLEKILYEELDKKDSQLNNKSILKIMNNINSNSKEEHNYESTIENTNITIKNKIEETVRKILNDNGYETLADIDKVISDISKNIYDKNLLMNENAEYTDSKFKDSIRESIIENQRINEHIKNQASLILNDSKETLKEKSNNSLLDIINKESRNGNNYKNIYQSNKSELIKVVNNALGNSQYTNQDLAEEIVQKNVNLHKSKNYDRIIESMFYDALNNENDKFNKLNNNIFDMNLIKRTLNDKNMNQEDITKLENMLNNYIDIEEDDKKEIVERMREHKPIGDSFSDKSLKTIIKNILNHKCFSQEFNNNIDNIYFISKDKNGKVKTVHSITNCFDKKIKNINSSGNNGYLEDNEYDLMVKLGAIFVKPYGKDQLLYIPQENDIALGRADYYNVQGYCYKDLNNPDNISSEKKKLNSNIVGKYIYNKDDYRNSLKNFINALIDSQKNENLYDQLKDLYNTINKNENYLSPDGSKFKDPNQWRNTILIHHIIDLYELSFTNYERIKRTIDNIGKYIKNDQYNKNRMIGPLAEEIANHYTIQQMVYPQDNNIKKGLKLDENSRDYINLKNKIEEALNNPTQEFLDTITNRLVDDNTRTKKIINRTNKIINLIDGNNYSTYEQRNFLKYDRPESKTINMNKLKNDFNKKFPYLDFHDTVLYKDSNKYLQSIENISSKELNTINNPNRSIDGNNKEIAVYGVKGMNEKGLQQRFYAINKDGHVNGISLEKDHLDRISNQMELYETVTSNTNLCSNGKCNFNNIVKRGSSGNSCHTVPKINMNINLDDTTLETLKSLKNKEIDSKILPNYNNVDSILNTKNLYENSESISDVWNKLTNTYCEHIHKFSESESETFLANFNIIINEYKYMLSNSDYINNPLIQNITPEMIDSMETDLTRAYNYHYEHFDDNNSDNDDNVLKQYRMDYKKDSQSKLNREKFIHTLNSIVNLINQIEGNPICGLGTIYNGNTVSSEINPNSIVSGSVDIKDAIDKLVEKIQSLDNSYNNELIDIYNNLSELYSINDMEYGLNQKTSINSELVHKLYNAVSEKLAINNSLDENIKPSDNSLKVPGLERVENANLINTIKDNYVSNEDKMYILKGMEHQINNSPSKYLDNQLYKIIDNINTHINNQIEQLKKFTSHIGHILETSNIVSLAAAYNDLVTTAIYNNKIYSNDVNNNSPVNTLEFDNEFNDRVNFVINIQLNEAIINTANNNPSIYNPDVQINSGNKFIWGGNTVYEASNTVLSKFNKDGTSFTSKAEFVSQLINNADGSTYRILQQSYSLKYNYVNYQSPASRDQNHINELEHNYNKLRFKHVQKNIQSIDTYHSSQFFSALSVVASYNPNLTPLATEDDNKNIVNVRTMYKGASNYKEMFTAMNEFETNLKNSNQLTDDIKSKIDDAANKFSTDIQVTSYKLAKMAGRENQSTFSTFTNEFSSVANYVSGYLKNNVQYSNNGRNVPQFKYNQNVLNVVHNHNLNNYNINKNIKELRISSTKANKQTKTNRTH